MTKTRPLTQPRIDLNKFYSPATTLQIQEKNYIIKMSSFRSGPSGRFWVRTLISDQNLPNASVIGITTPAAQDATKFLLAAQVIFQTLKHGVTHQICYKKKTINTTKTLLFVAYTSNAKQANINPRQNAASGANNTERKV